MVVLDTTIHAVQPVRTFGVRSTLRQWPDLSWRHRVDGRVEHDYDEERAARNVGVAGSQPSGFTLLEMLVVVLIAALAAGLLLGRGPPRSATLDLRAAASELARTLREARLAAITTGRPVPIRFDVPGHAYAAPGVPVHLIPSSFALTLVSAAPGAADAPTAIGFAPDGSSSGGRIGLAEAGGRIEVDVAWLTGRVTVSPVEADDAQ